MIFGVWGIVKTIISSIYSDDRLFAEIPPTVLEHEDLYKACVIVVLVIIFAIILAIRTFIGRSAHAQSRGEKYKKRYIVFVVFELVFSAATFVFLCMEFTEDPFNSFFALIVELTNAYACFEVASCSLKLRKLEKRG